MLKILFIFLSLFSITSIANETVMEVIPLYNRPASELQPLIRPLLEGSEHVIANGSNLIIKASPRRIIEIKNLLKNLDTQLTNLAITVLQSRTRSAEDLNASANIRLHVPIDHPSKTSGRIRGRFAQTEGLSNSESTQVVRTLEGSPARIKTGKVHPIQNIHVYDSGYGHPSISTNTQLIEATTGFIVTPRLTGNQVTMNISPWSDTMNNSGIIDTQGASTTIRVNLGEWVEIGGADEHSQRSSRGVFSREYSTDNNNLRILIKVEKSH
jgi:type II secretory pathway component GspD/PulD (secretin)